LSLANIEKLAKGLETSIPILFTPNSLSRGTVENPQDILLVEDDPGDVEMTLRAFKKACVTNRVRVAHDGAEALDYLFCTGPYSNRSVEERPQVVLLDLSLPKINGMEVLRRMKNDQRTRSIPVVVLSASEWGRDMDETKNLGAEGFVTKPVDFARFSQVTPHLRLCWALLKSKDGLLS
jgi:CheY-like chemotaxis protein